MREVSTSFPSISGGSPCCTPPCSLLCMQHVENSTGRVRGTRVWLAVRAAGTDADAAIYTIFTFGRTKSRRLPTNLRNQAVALHSSSANRRTEADRVPLCRLEHLYSDGVLCQSLCSSPKEERHQDSHLSLLQSLFGGQLLKAPSPYSVLARRQEQIDDWSPHSHI